MAYSYVFCFRKYSSFTLFHKIVENRRSADSEGTYILITDKTRKNLMTMIERM